MFIKHSIVKPWVICEPGDPVEVISARHKTAIVVRCNGQTLTVSSEDITDVNPVPLKEPMPYPTPAKPHETKLKKVELKQGNDNPKLF